MFKKIGVEEKYPIHRQVLLSQSAVVLIINLPR